jgi:predicted SAM-dependent methyltransferase
MSKKYLNVGCGSHFVSSEEWTNLDFVSTSEQVIAHNLLNGIPFPDNSFDLVYHSHVLEHFSKEDGKKLIKECFRVLKPGGVIRIAIPNLEEIAKNYLKYLELSVLNPENSKFTANYDWSLIEMFDQTVRNNTGGAMLKYLAQKNLDNEEFVMGRIGQEGITLRKNILNSLPAPVIKNGGLVWEVKQLIKRFLALIIGSGEINEFERIGRFRLGGEIHQWMYDRFSLRRLLEEADFTQFVIRDSFFSYIENWEQYELDGKKPIVRKPDSLYVEALKVLK